MLCVCFKKDNKLYAIIYLCILFWLKLTKGKKQLEEKNIIKFMEISIFNWVSIWIVCVVVLNGAEYWYWNIFWSIQKAKKIKRYQIKECNWGFAMTDQIPTQRNIQSSNTTSQIMEYMKWKFKGSSKDYDFKSILSMNCWKIGIMSFSVSFDKNTGQIERFKIGCFEPSWTIKHNIESCTTQNDLGLGRQN